MIKYIYVYILTGDELMSEKKNTYSGIFIVICMLHVTCLLVSNLIAAKMWAVTDSIVVPASVILFPVTYIIADVVTEVYGFRSAKTVIWLGFFCNFIAVIAYVITIDLPYPASWIDQDAFAIVFGFTPRVLLASFVAYLFGAFSNCIILSRVKVIMKGKKLWVRTIGSSVVGDALDSLIFVTLSFAGTVSTSRLVTMIIYQYLFKLLFETVLTPLTYYVCNLLKKKEEIDTYDYDKNYRLI